MSSWITKPQGIVSIAGALIWVFTSFPAEASTVDMTTYYADALRRYGYQTDTAEHILSARAHPSYFVRYAALYVLVGRVGQEALPTLIDALNDDWPDVRIHAAHLLGTLGSKAGLERLRRDMQELAPSRGVLPVYDPNMPPRLKERSERQWRYNVGLALECAKVLAELGDCSGYEVAERIALDAASLGAYYRALAVSALAELARVEKDTPPTEQFHPTLALCALAASETDPYILKRIRTAAVALGGTQALDILSTARDNPHQPQDQLRLIDSSLARLRKQESN